MNSNAGVKVYYSELSNQVQIAQLQQLTSLTWDGDLIDKEVTRKLYEFKYIDRWRGWNLITRDGVEHLITLGFLNK